MKRLSMYYQVNILKITYHVIAIWGVVSLPVGNWWIASIAGYFLFTRLGSDVGFHRYFTHRSFKTVPAVENFLLLLGTLDCKGSMYSWVVSHHAHHAHTEKEGDPHSPHRIGFFRVWFIAWEDFPVSKRAIAGYLGNPFFRFTHDHYLPIVLTFILLLGFIDLHLLVYFFCVPMVYSIHMTGVINTVGHSFGYRNFATDDESRNNLVVNTLSLGGGLHNNHHAFPHMFRQSTERWYEWDPAATFVELVRVKPKQST